jgi:hypothetical protein
VIGRGVVFQTLETLDGCVEKLASHFVSDP